ncbi:uncharacterized protein LOC135101039 [Scylla paramamosain]|uniref:uncharacterized protein LOC135101039 n=1 Tax=Scylla paramamosain TaxID=85552 RepID=UPI0030832B74
MCICHAVPLVSVGSRYTHFSSHTSANLTKPSRINPVNTPPATTTLNPHSTSPSRAPSSPAIAHRTLSPVSSLTTPDHAPPSLPSYSFPPSTLPYHMPPDPVSTSCISSVSTLRPNTSGSASRAYLSPCLSPSLPAPIPACLSLCRTLNTYKLTTSPRQSCRPGLLKGINIGPGLQGGRWSKAE